MTIKSKLKEVEGKLANLLKALEAGIFNDTTAERMNVLENEKNMLADALLAEQNRKKYDLKYDDVLRFLESFIGDLNNPDTRRTLLDGLIDKIYVYPDKLAITSFYSGDRRELPFGETVELIKNRQSILALLDGGQYDLAETEASAIMLESLSGDTEEPPGFFP